MHALAVIERTRLSPTARPMRRVRCSCGALGEWRATAALALRAWREHAGIDLPRPARG